MTPKTVYSHTEKTVLHLYAMIAAGTVLSMMPLSFLPYAGLACMLVGFMAAYVYRFKDRDNEVMSRHMRYITATMWWSVPVLFVGIALFGCIVYFNGDLGAIHALMADTEKGIVPTEDDVRAMEIAFIGANQSLIMIAAAITLLPYPLFILWRIFRGVRMVKKKG